MPQVGDLFCGTPADMETADTGVCVCVLFKYYHTPTPLFLYNSTVSADVSSLN